MNTPDQQSVPLIGGATLKVYSAAAPGLTVTHEGQFDGDLLAFLRGSTR